MDEKTLTAADMADDEQFVVTKADLVEVIGQAMGRVFAHALNAAYDVMNMHQVTPEWSHEHGKYCGADEVKTQLHFNKPDYAEYTEQAMLCLKVERVTAGMSPADNSNPAIHDVMVRFQDALCDPRCHREIDKAIDRIHEEIQNKKE